MGRRNKLQKFAELITFPNVYENMHQDDPDNTSLLAATNKSIVMKGKWMPNHFQNSNPLILELACGRGEYGIALAQQYSDQNFIGVDVKGARIWQGARIAAAANLDNVAFLRTRIEMIDRFFDHQEVSEIWITFPDPFLKDSKSDRRLTSAPFLARYKNIIRDGGLIHLKTDDPTLYDYSMETLQECPFITIDYHCDDIYAQALEFDVLEYKTYYEKMHLQKGRTIKYIRCSVKF